MAQYLGDEEVDRRRAMVCGLGLSLLIDCSEGRELPKKYCIIGKEILRNYLSFPLYAGALTSNSCSHKVQCPAGFAGRDVSNLSVQGLRITARPAPLSRKEGLAHRQTRWTVRVSSLTPGLNGKPSPLRTQKPVLALAHPEGNQQIRSTINKLGLTDQPVQSRTGETYATQP